MCGLLRLARADPDSMSARGGASVSSSRRKAASLTRTLELQPAPSRAVSYPARQAVPLHQTVYERAKAYALYYPAHIYAQNRPVSANNV